ncbi:MAG: chloramphenicol acetyltransferase, partial [Desulfovibrio sp.]|uniref:CatA-like O-acetyltransferase n=1 Tax=Desulfovibrio sp. TaxID=885 RepID=UPI0025891BEA
SITAPLDITLLMRRRRQLRRRFFPILLYVVMRAVNRRDADGSCAPDSPDILDRGGNGAFRMAFDARGRLGRWNYCNPVYTVFHEEDASFSDLWSQWSPDFSLFYETVLDDMARYGGVRGLKGRPHTPENFCSVSSLPWLSFTSFAQDTYAESRLLFPLIRVGKHFVQGRKTLIPVALSVHHAVADGFHTSKLFHDMQTVADAAEQWLC